jgi:hypothetical protein
MGGSAPLVDKMIGTAYDKVALVSKNLELLQYVADHMEDLLLVSTQLRNSQVVEGVSGQLGALVTIPLPEGVAQNMVVASSIILVASDGALYGEEYFSSYILENALKISLKMSAPTSLIGSGIRWYVTYGV